MGRERERGRGREKVWVLPTDTGNFRWERETERE